MPVMKYGKDKKATKTVATKEDNRKPNPNSAVYKKVKSMVKKKG